MARMHAPGRAHRVVRRAIQFFTLAVICVAPLLGGWQRLDSNHLGAWDGRGWDLPAMMLQVLPGGDAPARAYDTNRALGGGMAVDYFGVPALDPVAGALVLTSGEQTGWMLLAWALPVLLALLVGRVFCGWLCPFGTISRLLEAALARLPWRPPRRAVPTSRPLRWLLLLGCVLSGALGVPGLLYLFMPHALLQQSVYSAWLMGGGGAVFGWFLGLVLAGLALGPTVYCATLCPTGAALSVNGRRRLTRVTLAKATACGTHCELCTRACWLDLDPASGDPGPDCDSCARCFAVCPRDNLRVGLGRRTLPVLAGLLVVAGLPAAGQADGRASPKPGLVLEGARRDGDTVATLALVDLREVRLDADDPRTERVTQLSLVVWRGESGPVDALGKQAARETYLGPLQLIVRDAAGDETHRVSFSEALAPRSAPRRRLYRRDLAMEFEGGSQLELLPIEGWTAQSLSWQVPRADRAGAWRQTGWGVLAGLPVFFGLLSLALLGSAGVFFGRGRNRGRANSREHLTVER